jgi:hypothetical protein
MIPHNGAMSAASSFIRYNVEKRVLFSANGKCIDALTAADII